MIHIFPLEGYGLIPFMETYLKLMLMGIFWFAVMDLGF